MKTIAQFEKKLLKASLMSLCLGGSLLATIPVAKAEMMDYPACSAPGISFESKEPCIKEAANGSVTITEGPKGDVIAVVSRENVRLEGSFPGSDIQMKMADVKINTYSNFPGGGFSINNLSSVLAFFYFRAGVNYYNVLAYHPLLKNPEVVKGLTGSSVCVPRGGSMWACTNPLVADIALPLIDPEAEITTAANWDIWAQINFTEQPAYTVDDPTPTREYCVALKDRSGKKILQCGFWTSPVPQIVEYKVNQSAENRAGKADRQVVLPQEIDILQSSKGYASCLPRDPAKADTIVCSNRTFTLPSATGLPVIDPLPALPRPPVCDTSTTNVAGESCYDPNDPSPIPLPPSAPTES